MQKRRKVQLSAYQEQIKSVAEACLDEMEDLDNPVMGHQCTGVSWKRSYASESVC